MKSWKTTVGGIGGILAALATVLAWVSKGYVPSMEEAALVFAAFSNGISGFFARDDNVTSEQAGLKPVSGVTIQDLPPERKDIRIGGSIPKSVE